MGAWGHSAGRKGPGARAHLPRGTLGLRLRLRWCGPEVCEVLGTAFSSEARATTPGEVRHRLVAHLVSGSEHRAVPGPGAGEGRALCPWAGDLPPAGTEGCSQDSGRRAGSLPASLPRQDLPLVCASKAEGWQQAFQRLRDALGKGQVKAPPAILLGPKTSGNLAPRLPRPLGPPLAHSAIGNSNSGFGSTMKTSDKTQPLPSG